MTLQLARKRCGMTWDALARRYYHKDQRGRRQAHDRAYRVMMRAISKPSPVFAGFDLSTAQALDND